jgi:hypothetical protein
MVVMYADLLMRALGDSEKGVGTYDYDSMLGDLAESRTRLRAPAAHPAMTAAEALARELSYDGALVRLCDLFDVVVSFAAFGEDPLGERARLERELYDRGVPLDPTCFHGRPLRLVTVAS